MVSLEFIFHKECVGTSMMGESCNLPKLNVVELLIVQFGPLI